MNIIETKLAGALIIEPQVFGDSRGFFLETWNQARYAECGLAVNFIQDNLSFSQRGVLRGLYFQNPYTQGKLVQVLQGEVFDVVVDIRQGSPTFGECIFCKNFLQKVASNFSIVLQLHFPQCCKFYFPAFLAGK